MEPRFFKRGNSVKSVNSAIIRKASMEPRFFKRGNDAGDVTVDDSNLLQWNHVFSNVEITSPAHRSK